MNRNNETEAKNDSNQNSNVSPNRRQHDLNQVYLNEILQERNLDNRTTNTSTGPRDTFLPTTVENDSLFSLTARALSSSTTSTSCWSNQRTSISSSTRCTNVPRTSARRSNLNNLRDILSLALDVCDDVQFSMENENEV
jgi:predicted Ser/Thr protein kinase